MDMMRAPDRFRPADEVALKAVYSVCHIFLAGSCSGMTESRDFFTSLLNLSLSGRRDVRRKDWKTRRKEGWPMANKSQSPCCRLQAHLCFRSVP